MTQISSCFQFLKTLSGASKRVAQRHRQLPGGAAGCGAGGSAWLWGENKLKIFTDRMIFTKLWKSFTTVTVAPYVSHFCQFQFQSNKSCCFQITIPKTDFYLREELELFEYPSKSSTSSSSPSSLWTLWLVNDGGSAGRSLLSLGRAQSCCWFIPTLSTLPTLFTLSRTHCRWVFSSQYTGNVSYVFRALPVLRVSPTLSCIFT